MWSDDFDTGASLAQNAVPAVEIMQMDPQAAALLLPDVTEIQQLPQAAFVSTVLSPEARAVVLNASDVYTDWGTVVNYATTYGIGQDNPTDPNDMTAQQSARSVMLTFDTVSSFDVRYFLQGGRCTNAGRNSLDE